MKLHRSRILSVFAGLSSFVVVGCTQAPPPRTVIDHIAVQLSGPVTTPAQTNVHVVQVGATVVDVQLPASSPLPP